VRGKERKTVLVRQLTASQVPERMRWASEHTSTELSLSLSFFTLTNHTHELWLIQSQPPHLPAASFSKSLSPHSLFSKHHLLFAHFLSNTQFLHYYLFSFSCALLFSFTFYMFLTLLLWTNKHLISDSFCFYREEQQYPGISTGIQNPIL